MAVEDVRDAEISPPEHPEETPEQNDSLLMFSPEGATSESSYVAPPRAVIPPSRHFTGHAVPAAIIDDRALREAVSKLDGYADTLAKLQALCAAIDGRLEKAEATHRRTEQATTDGSLRELSARIDSRLVETEQAALRIERMVASGAVEEQSALQALRSHIGEQLEKTEEIARRTEGVIADRTVRELSAYIDTRVMGTDEVVRRIEQLVTSRSREELSALQALHADIDRRLAQAEDVRRRPVASEAPLAPVAVLPDWQRVVKPLVAVIALAVVSILFMFKAPGTSGSPTVTRMVDREQQVRDGLVQASAPSAPIPAPTGFQPQPPARSTVGFPPPLQPRALAPALAAPTRRAAVATPPDDVGPRTYVGDLSIVSTPAGARVFINGRNVGVTPLVLYERQAGSVAIQIASDGFERWSASVQVRAGQTTNVAATLRPARP